jgi:very-short-patch-repair endonuclease
VRVLGVRAPIVVSGGRDARVAAIAARQRGVVTRSQLRAAGLSDSAVDRMCRRGRLIRLHPGVFAVGHVELPRFGLETAAILAVGFDAVLSYRSAAALWGFLPQAPERVEVTVVDRQPQRTAGVRVHRTKHLEARDIRTFQRLPVTSPARTLLDLADTLDWPQLERALAEAWGLKRVSLSTLNDVLNRAGGRRGAPKLKALIAPAGQRLSDSDGERKLFSLLRQAGLPLPLTQQQLHGWRVDFFWPEHGLVLELDSYQFHSGRWAFERDRRKTAALSAAGLRVTRASGSQLSEEPVAVVAQLAQALVQRRAA